MSKAEIGLIGLAVMGENLVMNMESKGFTIAVYNRSTEKVDNFINGRAKGKKSYRMQKCGGIGSGTGKTEKSHDDDPSRTGCG